MRPFTAFSASWDLMQSVNCLVSQALTELDGMTRLMRGLRQVTAFTKEVVNLGPDSHFHKQ